MPETQPTTESPVRNDSDLLRELKSEYNFCSNYWKDIYDEGDKDMQYVAGKPWPEGEVQDRTQSGRLCLTFDELNQYLNQCINDVRQNKRAVKVSPKGDGANDQTAYLRAGIIRGAEYECKAPRAYIRAFENMVQRSFGFFKLTWDYESPRSMNRVLKVVQIPNPKTILGDPDGLEPDGSDWNKAFELKTMSEDEFRREYGSKASITSFTDDHMESDPKWITEGTDGKKRVQVVAYWKRKKKTDTLVVLADGTNVLASEKNGKVVTVGEDAFFVVDGMPAKPVREYRETVTCEVSQHISNGLEVLDTIPWEGESIPLYPMFGKELFLDSNGQAKRVILSMVRAARDPFLAYCWACTSEIESAGMIPKMMMIGYEGQFGTNTDWENLNRKLVPFAEVKPKTAATGDAILPLPQPVTWQPAIEALEVTKNTARVAIQSAMGISSFLSGRNGQVNNAKSGIALKELDQQESQGSFHFIDAYDAAVERCGRDMNDLLGPVYGGRPREVAFIDRKEKAAALKIGQPGQHPDDGKPINLDLDEGAHNVTISTGPSYQTQRQQAGDFADTLVANAQVLGPATPKVLALAVKLKDLGPLGDAMAEAIDPSIDGKAPQLPPGVQQHIAQADQVIAQQTQTIQTMTMEREAKNAEIAAKLHQINTESSDKRYAVDQTELTKRTLGLAQVNVQEGMKALEQELGVVKAKMEIIAAGHAQAADHAHEFQMAQQQHSNTLEQQQEAAENEPEPEPAGTGK